MGEIMGKVCSFFGHRQITNTENLRKVINCLVEKLIVEKGYQIFLFGGLGANKALKYAKKRKKEYVNLFDEN